MLNGTRDGKFCGKSYQVYVMDDDYALALQLQSEFFEGSNNFSELSNSVATNGNEPRSLVDPYWEVTDPNPDVRALFLQFNDRFFWGTLAGVEVRWSPRMTLCAGLCCYEGRGGLCSVRLSVPLLKLRPRKDLIETLLHEMIHAYLFITDNNKDHDGHGPEFHKHMYRINNEAGTNISVYHNFHDEVDSYKQHWWRCNGPCQNLKPYFGYVKRSMNRAPSKNDTWWSRHQQTCGGTYTKVKEPENYGKKKKDKEKDKEDLKKKEKEKSSGKNMDIRIFGGEGKTVGNLTKPFHSTNTTPKSDNVLPNKNTGSAIHRPIESISRPKPSSTVSRFDDNSSGKDKAKETKQEQQLTGHVTILPGAITPSKSSASKNKPVSQGGMARFNNKKTVVNLPDFSDSDSDDDFLCSIPLSDLSNTSMCSTTERNETAKGSSQWNNSNIDDSSISGDTSESKSDHLKDNKELKDKHESQTDCDVTKSDNEKFERTDSEVSDVRAMLRKVWGQKQFGNQTSKIKVKGTFKSVIQNSDTSWSSYSSSSKLVTGAIKRLSGDSGFSERSAKRHKNNSIYTPETGNSDLDNSQKDKNSPSKQLTSPIDKYFNKTDPGSSSKNDLQKCSSFCDEISVIRGDNSVNNSAFTDSSETSSCPVCNKKVPTSSINDHLDLCLTMQAM